jgi:protection of telomeres protein 1
MAGDGEVAVPANFVNLSSLRAGKSHTLYNVIGVCVDFLSPKKCRNGAGDWKIAFTLHDPSWTDGQGMEIAFFRKAIDELPQIQSQGDVVILRGVKVMDHQGLLEGISNYGTTWTILPIDKLDKINSVPDLKENAQWYRKGSTGHLTMNISESELKYAKWIASQADPSSWPPARPKPRVDTTEATIHTGASAPPLRKEKFKLIKDLEIPGERTIFADLAGEVRKIYNRDWLIELYITDYTINENLYNYKPNSTEGGRDGDPYGHIPEGKSQWPGPWGQMTMTICCRDRQRDAVNATVKPGDIVFLRNVHLKMDKQGLKLEGNCRDDDRYPNKVLIEVLKTNDEKRKQVLQRKRDYEEKAKVDGLEFRRDPLQAQKKRPRAEPVQGSEQPKAKKSKNRSRKEKRAAAEQEPEQQPKAKAAAITRQERQAAANEHIRILQHEGLSGMTVADILDPAILTRKTPGGNSFQLPFQNCKYKSKVRVVDFFPQDVADFAAPRRTSQYDELSDCERSDDDSDIDLTQAPSDQDLEWRWRFFLLIEDARPQPGRQGTPTQMELLVADGDGDYLFNMEACNLRAEENESKLAVLKEKLFHLWGDLLEKKEEATGTQEAMAVKPSSRPFECLIKEYGIPVRNQEARTPVKGIRRYDRLFRLFGTTI